MRLNDDTLAVCGANMFNECDKLDCAACNANANCSFCGSLNDQTYGENYGYCVKGKGVCNNNDTVLAAACPAFVADSTTICEALSCGQCNVQQDCTWCGSGNNGTCISNRNDCPIGRGPASDTCDGAVDNGCESLSCDTCRTTPGCSFCSQTDAGSSTGVYGYCVKGNNACAHNDSTTTQAQCAAYAVASSSICDVLSCSQCISGAVDNNCYWCGGPHGSCSARPCSDYADNSTICGVELNECDKLSCTDCIKNPKCSFCGTSDYNVGPYGVCVLGKDKCTHNDTVTTAAACAALDLELCPLLTCSQCGPVLGCHWCGSPSSSKCSRQSCTGTDAEIVDGASCTAPKTMCEQITDCDKCRTTAGCDFCYDYYTELAACVTGTAVCGNSSLTTAQQCADANLELGVTSSSTLGSLTSKTPQATTQASGAGGSTTSAGTATTNAGGSKNGTTVGTVTSAGSGTKTDTVTTVVHGKSHASAVAFSLVVALLAIVFAV